MSTLNELAPYQEAVVEEKRELDRKLSLLTSFINSEAFKAVDPTEQQRMRRQELLMFQLSGVLHERILAF